MRFVQDICEKWGVPFYIFQDDCIDKAEREKLSLETAARAFRRDCFLALVRERKADYIATAHHISDQAETVLFHIARGSALSGVGGMQEMDGVFIRPFLTWTKEDILAYTQEHGLQFRTDSTNLTPCATRNKLRLQVIPALKEIVSGAEENIARFALLATQDEAFLTAQSEKLITRTDENIIVAFSQERSLFRRACLLAMQALGVEKDYTYTHLESVFLLQRLERGAKISLPQGVRAEKALDGVIFYRQEELPPVSKATEKFSQSGFDGGRYAVKVQTQQPTAQENAWKVLRIDGDALPKNAVFRFRQDGDYIQKFGGGTKSLKKLFNEKKIPVAERAYLPLVAEEQGNRVFVVCGVEIADQVKVTNETKQVLYLSLQKQD